MPEYVGVDGITIIRLTGQIDEPDDLTYPWKLRVALQPPNFMSVTYILTHGGTEELIARGMTREALEEMLTREGLRTHPRLIGISITGPDGMTEQIG